MKRLIVLVTLCTMTALTFGCGKHTAPTPSADDVGEFDNAVKDGDTDIVTRLLQAKPEMVNAKDPEGNTPLKLATQKADQPMEDLLRKHGGHE